MTLTQQIFKRALLSSSAIVFAGPVGHAVAQSVPNNIVPDGRTGTQLAVSGATTTITTSSVRGGTAYNSFSTFQERAGNTVNLIVPQQAGTLVNIVRNGPAVVDGTLNSYKNGQIGGNIVFADSYGLVVGKSGVINTGGLSVVTPTNDYLDKVINSKGRIDPRAAAGLRTGDFPISPNGSVVINGRVNVQRTIMMRAFNVAVPGPTTRLMQHQVMFESTVNTSGMRHGGGLVSRNGRIEIVASNGANVGGVVRTGATRTVTRTRTVMRTRTVSVPSVRYVKVWRPVVVTTPVVAATTHARKAVTSPVAHENAIVIDADTATITGQLISGGARGGSIAITTHGSLTVGKDAKLVARAPLVSTGTVTGVAAASIVLKAGTDLDVAGTLIANGAPGAFAGTISLAAVGAIAIEGTASLSAQGVGDASAGGAITVKAATDLTVADGASFNAAAGKSGAGGSVDLSAVANANLGTLAVDVSAANGKAGVFSIDPDTLTISGQVTLANSQGYANGGNIVISADESIELTGSASINTQNLGSNGFSTADSGSVTITAPSITLDAGSRIQTQALNQSGSQYKDGSVSLLAETTGPLSSGLSFAGILDVSIAGSIKSGAVLVTANEDQHVGAIRVVSGGSIDTSHSGVGGDFGFTANGASIALTAQNITLQQGSTLTSGNSATPTGATSNNDVTLTAANASNAASGLALASSSIDVAGSINSAGKVTVSAASSATSSLTDLAHVDDPAATVDGLLGTAVGQLAAQLLSGGSTLIATDATASVSVDGTATIKAAGDVTLASLGIESATNPLASTNVASSGGFGGKVGLAVVGGVINSNVSTTIASGASVATNGSLAVTASNSATLDVTSTNYITNGATFTGGLAVGVTLINTNATVAGGAKVSTGSQANVNTLSVVAQNQNSFDTAVESTTFGDATAGAVLALGLYESSAVAHLGASISNTGGVTVQAINNTSKSVTAAEVTLGGNNYGVTVLSLAPGSVSKGLGSVTNFNPGSAIVNVVPDSAPSELTNLISKADSLPGSTFLKTLLPSSSSGTPSAPSTDLVTLAGALTVVETDQGASASIAADAGFAAPAITSTGNVAVVSQTIDGGIRQDVSASGTLPSNSSEGIAAALALNLGVYFHSSEAYIGNDVSITAANVGVAATTSVPIDTPWATFDGPSAILDNVSAGLKNDASTLKSVASTNLGLVSDFVTSYADSTASGGNGAISVAGSLDAYFTANTTTAWIGSGAQITTTSTGGGWSVPLPLSVPTSLTDTKFTSLGRATFATAVDVEAQTTSEAINVAGDFSWLLTLKGSVGTQSGGNGSAGLGGSFALDVSTSNTTAGIGDGAVIQSPGGVTVNAQTTNEILTVAPTDGRGADVALSGIGELILLDDHTHASISNGADIIAGSVSVTAEQDNSVLGIAGAVDAAKADGAGLALAGVLAFGDTQAYVGDNDREVAGSSYASTGVAAATAQIATDALNVDATTAGGVIALSVAAEFVSPNDGMSLNSTIQKSGIAPEFVKTGSFFLSALVKPASGGPALTGQVATAGGGALTAATTAANGGALGKLKGLAASAAAGAKDGIQGGLNSALNGTSTPTEYQEVSVALAGSTSLGITILDTTASISGATIVHGGAGAGQNSVNVQAINDGAILVLSGSAAINLTPTSNTSFSVAAAGAFGLDANYNATSARIENSTVKAGSVSVLAVSNGDVIVAGGGVAVNTNIDDGIAVAGSLTVGLVLSSDNATISNSTVTNDGTYATGNAVTVGSYNSTNIGVGAADVAGGGIVAFGAAITVAVVADPSPGTYGAGALVTGSMLSNYGAVTVEAFDVSRIIASGAAGVITPGDLAIAGSVVLNDILPTTSASIDGGSVITSGGNVTVESATNRDAGFDALIAAVPMPTSTAGGAVTNALNVGFDFVGLGIGLGSGNTGAAIVGFAGVLAGGQNAVGLSALYAGITESHTATIDDATIDVTGTVAVKASETSTIYSAAVGAAISTDLVAGLGSLNIDLVANTTSATIGGGDVAVGTTKVTAGNVDVTASVTSLISGYAGGVAGSVGFGIGYSIASGDDYDKVSASINAATITTSDSTIVTASSGTTIIQAASAAGIGGDEGVGGSIIFNFDYATVAAGITNGSIVKATGNVGVFASNSDSIAALGGSLGVGLNAAGIGETEVANLNLNETTATISNATVDAEGLTGPLTINTGTLAHPLDLEQIALANAYSAADLSETTTTIHGLAVDATSGQSTITRAGAVSFSIDLEDDVSVSLSLIPVINGLQGYTRASIANSAIDTNLAGASKPDVSVIAGSHSFNENIATGVAATGGGSATGAFTYSDIDRQTQATITGGTIGTSASPVGSVVVTAGATNDVFNVVQGFSFGAIAGVGSVLLNTFDETTDAHLYGTTVNAANLSVTAGSENGSIAEIGNRAVGVAGAAGGFNVLVDDSTTLAYVGAGNGETATLTTLNVTGALSVKANSTVNVYDFTADGALGAVSLAGTFDANTQLETTRAGLYDVDATSLSSATVAAEEDTVMLPVAGAAVGGGSVLGGVGLGGSINLVVLESSVTSEIVASTIVASGAVSVTGTTNRDISLQTVTAAAVFTSPDLAGSLGLLLVGTNAPSSLSSNLNTSVETADSATGGSHEIAKSSDPGFQDTSSLNRTDAVSTALNSGAVDGITARVNDSQVTAGALTVTAVASLETANRSDAAAFGGVGAGAALAFTIVEDTIQASIDAASTINVGTLNVTATAGDLTQAAPNDGVLSGAFASGQSVYIQAIAGAGSLGSGLGAAVGVGTVDDAVTASVAGTVTGAGAAATGTITATDSRSLSVKTVGADVGVVALGASIATATKESQVLSGLAVLAGNSATLTNFSTIGVGAVESGAVLGQGDAGSLGLGTAGNAAVGIASDSGTVEALLGAGASVATSNGLSVTATANPDVEGASFGVAVGVSAVGASVASSDANAQVSAVIGNGAHITSGGLTLEAFDTPTTGNSASYATATAGSGSLFINAQASVATATTGSTVVASIGDDATTAGTLIVLASNTSDANAVATGVNVGLFAVGAVVANATSNNTTSASVGTGAVIGQAATASVPSPTVSIQAVGTDTLEAQTTAGTGGLVSGDASVATLTDNATVTTSIGANTMITAQTLDIGATHNADYQAHADSVNASVVGASGAFANSAINSNVSVTTGSGSTFVVSGQACAAVGVCAPSVQIAANNTFLQTGIGANQAANASAGAGGILTGAAATSTTTLNGTSTVTLGANSTIASGTTPRTQPGDISIVANNVITNTGDTVTLSTGGLIAGAGTNSSLTANLTDAIEVGSGAVLATSGNLSLATYNAGTINANAYDSTSGGAAIGSATANADLVSVQTVTVDDDAQLVGFGNVYVTAGRDIAHGNITDLGANSTAQAYVSGLVAIPSASSEATTSSKSNVTIGAASLSSGQNIVVGGYEGLTTPTSNGTAHGYELGFIPITHKDNSTSAPRAATVTLNGSTITAGIYHDLELTIGTAGNPGDYTVSENASGVPVTYLSSNTFSPTAYIAALFPPDVAAVLDTGVAQGTVQSIAISSQLYAAGGTVTVNADAFAGRGGTVTSYGSPTINVQNYSNAYLIVAGGAYIPDTPGGQVFYTGLANQAAAQAAGITTTAVAGSGISGITINNSYAAPTGFGPAQFLVGDITNLGGFVDIENATGSIGQKANISAQQVTLNAPNGVYAVQANDNGNYIAGESPIALYESAMITPGSTDPNEAVTYVANYLFGAGTTNGGQLNQSIYGQAGDTPDTSHTNNSTVFFGHCAPYAGGGAGCGSSGYFISSSGNQDSGGDALPAVTYLLGSGLSHQSTAAGTALVYQIPTGSAAVPTQTASIQAFGGQVIIDAGIVDVNASIKAGQPTNQSIVIPSSAGTATAFGQEIAILNAQYAASKQDQTTDISSYVQIANSGDSLIKASYDAATQSITLANVNASSGGGQVTLKGAIINTSPTAGLSNVTVNGGLGQVTVENNSGLGLTLQNINTGNTAAASLISSRVTVIDTLQTDRYATVYVYSGGATTVYDVPNATALTSLTPAMIDTGASKTQYSPLAGERFVYVEQAELTQGTNSDGTPTGQYTFSQPYAYAPATDATSLDGKINPTTLTATPTGHLTNDTSLTNVAFQEQITGGIDSIAYTSNIAYHQHYGFADTSFATTTGVTAGTPGALQDKNGVYFTVSGSDPAHYANPGAQVYTDYNAGLWHYNDVGSVWIKLTNSVKADTPFGINFVGNQTAFVNVASNNSVTLAGTITNPNGLTTISVSNGSILQNAVATTVTNGLTLAASGSIGTAAQPIAAQLTGGVLNAQAGSAGLNLAFSSPVTVQTASASTGATYGDVTLSALGSILSPTGQAGQVIGDNITLTSTNGSIGTATAPLDITAVGTTTASGATVGAVVSASAYGDVGLINQVGDLRLGQISSTTGDIYLTNMHGAVLDAASQTAADVLTAAQVATIDTLLGLTGQSAINRENATQAAFIAQVNNDAAQVRGLLGHGTVGTGVVYTAATIDSATLAFYAALYQSTLVQAARAPTANGVVTPPTEAQVIAFANGLQAANGSFQLSSDPATLQVYQAIANANLGTGATASSAQVQAYANTLYQTYASVLNEAYGASWQQSVTASTPFTAATNPTLLANFKLANAYANVQQLTDAVDQSSLQPAATSVGEGVANIVGRNVTITATGGVGQLGAPVPIAISDLDSGTLTSVQQAAIAVATQPGSVIVSGTGPGGATVTNIDVTKVVPGVTPTTLNVTQTDPLFINATGTLSVASGSVAYVQSTSAPNGNGATLTLGSVVAPTAVSLEAPNSIVQSAGTTGAAIFTGNLSLAAGSGNIGTSTVNPLIVDVTGELVSASAGQNVYLDQLPGSLSVGRVFANGTASLQAPGSITGALPGVTIAGATIDLNAGGSVSGPNGTALQVQVGPGGMNGSIGGSAALYAPSNLTNTANLNVGTLTATDGLSLTADAGVIFQGAASSAAGGITVQGATITMNIGSEITAAQPISLLATGGGVTLGQILSTAAPTSRQTEITVDAVGAITTNGDPVVNASVGGDGVVTFAGASVGTPDAPIAIMTPFVVASASTGGVYLTGTGDLTATLAAPQGGIGVADSGQLAVGTVASGGSQSFSGTNGVSFSLLTTTGLPNDIGNVTVTSSNGPIVGGSVAANGTVSLSGTSVTADTLASPVAVYVAATGEANVGSLLAPTIGFSTGGSATIGSLSASQVAFNAGGALTIGTLNVTNSATLDAPILNILNLQQTGGGSAPLQISIAGANGTVGDIASLNINAPNGVVFNQLAFDTATVSTTAQNVSIYNGYVPGSLTLATPSRLILLNDQSPEPVAGYSVQGYAPGYAFNLIQSGYGTLTNAFVVRFDALAQVTEILNGQVVQGANFVQDFDRLLFTNADDDWADQVRLRIQRDVERRRAGKNVVKIGDGPAVQLGASPAARTR